MIAACIFCFSLTSLLLISATIIAKIGGLREDKYQEYWESEKCQKLFYDLLSAAIIPFFCTLYLTILLVLL